MLLIVLKFMVLFLVWEVRTHSTCSEVEVKIEKLEKEFVSVLSSFSTLHFKYTAMYKELQEVKDQLRKDNHTKTDGIHLQSDSIWTSWTRWSICSLSCGGGRQYRNRQCSKDERCKGDAVEIRDCNKNRCWDEWSAWSECSRSCTGGRQHRSRACNKGPGCPRNDINIRDCNLNVTCTSEELPAPTYNRLQKPMMELDARKKNTFLKNTLRVRALADRKALVVVNMKPNEYHIYRLDATGLIEKTLYVSTESISELIVIDKDLLIIRRGGRIVRARLEDGRVFDEYDTRANVAAGAAAVNNSVLLIVDSSSNEAFTYSLSQRRKQVKIQGLTGPTCAAHAVTPRGALYLVCNNRRDTVNLYNSSWTLQNTIGGYGSENGKFIAPQSVVFSPVGTFWVADRDNSRISEFSTDGRFLRHILAREDDMYRPLHLSYSHPHLWVVYELSEENFHVRRYKIYME